MSATELALIAAGAFASRLPSTAWWTWPGPKKFITSLAGPWAIVICLGSVIGGSAYLGFSRAR